MTEHSGIMTPTPDEERQSTINTVVEQVLPNCLDQGRAYEAFDIRFAAGLAAAAMYDELAARRGAQ